MALRIVYLSNEETVMIISCPKLLKDAKPDALEGLAVYNADTARVLDMDNGGKVIWELKRNA